MSGSKVKIWKQDPSVKSIGIRTAYIPTQVMNGPKDRDIVIKGVPEVFANENNDFLYDPEENPIEFDAVHTYTVVRQVLTMFRRALNRNEITQNFDWQWGSEPINVYPRAGMDPNAFYNRGEHSLRFFYLPVGPMPTPPPQSKPIQPLIIGANLTIRPAKTTDTMLINLIRMLRLGPEVSLKGSPTVSPTTAALWAAEPLPPWWPSSMYFLALSQLPPAFAIMMASTNPQTVAPMSKPEWRLITAASC